MDGKWDDLLDSDRDNDCSTDCEGDCDVDRDSDCDIERNVKDDDHSGGDNMVCDFMDSDAKDASTIEGEDNDDAANIDTNYAPPPPKKKVDRQTNKETNLQTHQKKIKNRNNLFSFFYTINLFLSK